MKHADVETLIWLIVAAVILLAKGWSKLQGQIEKDTSAEDGTPPVERPKPLRPRPQSREAAPVGPRPVEAPMRGASPPVHRTPPRPAPAPGGSPPSRDTWQVDPEQIRRFMEQLSGQARPAPPPIAPPPVQKTEGPPPIRKTPVAPEPAPTTRAPAATTVTPPAMASAPAAAAPSRAAQWAEALRDRQNIRNIIISYEIIGPPRGA